jgi:HlyD family secretion protein
MTSGRTKSDTADSGAGIAAGTNTGSSAHKGFMDDMLSRVKQVSGAKTSSKWRSMAIVAVIALMLLIGFAVMQSMKKPVPHVATPVMTVTTIDVTRRAIPEEVLLTGSIWPWDPTQIACEIGNLRVQTVSIEEGAAVKKGQVLATLNSSVLRAQLAQAEARLSANKAAYLKAQQPNRVEDIAGLRAALAQANAGVERSRAALLQAKANYTNLRNTANRAISLAKEGAISSQEAETRDTQAKVGLAEITNAEHGISAAEFAAKQAREKLNMAVIGGRKEDVLMAQAAVAEQQAEVNRLRSLIAQTIITAPDYGLITRRLTHVGDTPQVGAVLFRLARQGRLELRASVPEKDLLKVRPQLPVKVQRADGKLIQGVVSLVVPEVDPDTRLGLVRITVPANEGLMPGMFVKGSLMLSPHEAIVVPSDCVISRDSRYFVFVLNGNKVTRTPVTVGSRTDDMVEIKSGLKGAEKIVLAGAGFLKDGDLVSIAENAEAPAASPASSSASHAVPVTEQAPATLPASPAAPALETR